MSYRLSLQLAEVFEPEGLAGVRFWKVQGWEWGSEGLNQSLALRKASINRLELFLCLTVYLC